MEENGDMSGAQGASQEKLKESIRDDGRSKTTYIYIIYIQCKIGFSLFFSKVSRPTRRESLSTQETWCRLQKKVLIKIKKVARVQAKCHGQ